MDANRGIQNNLKGTLQVLQENKKISPAIISISNLLHAYSEEEASAESEILINKALAIVQDIKEKGMKKEFVEELLQIVTSLASITEYDKLNRVYSRNSFSHRELLNSIKPEIKNVLLINRL